MRNLCLVAQPVRAAASKLRPTFVRLFGRSPAFSLMGEPKREGQGEARRSLFHPHNTSPRLALRGVSAPMGFFDKFFNREKKEDLDKGLEKTKEGFFDRINRAVVGKSTVDEEVLDELESVLISSDVGLDTAVKIIDRIEARVARDKYVNTSELNEILRDEIVQMLSENNTEDAEDF
ncbi:MAG TPA: signal recognition particle receptor subunit alpha, partial [Saprospiraceae bacterium]|nr:signal recognition particle receptor subunit alpha [Saprospiraceae bacterium]